MLFALKRIGYLFIDHWKVALAIVALMVVIVIGYRACNKPAKLNEAQIIKNQQAIETHDREVMKQALAESKVAEQGIDRDISTSKGEAVNAINQAKREADGLSNEELAQRLEELSKQ